MSTRLCLIKEHPWLIYESFRVWDPQGDVATTPLYPEGHFVAYSAEECCRTCQDSKGCNTWVW
ncbi:hypothetical protein DUNSADRAFT_9000 [Dunaliella salina]|uniref:Apple domain-containing protein n=1 Tax=Dunaliella salina TaxID=3046 RepID=A0ABQ7GIC9_DUNSA|nr:hypothetical protein DUNSADRAFT_9000 [Dunaliella salina]|eukprot:KAF5834377.1 hypothetical protein DUNSADRAFT_9000 [Dunaliella salina]